jgi:hypothetical protein
MSIIRSWRSGMLLGLATALLLACSGPTRIVTGTVRPAIDPVQVKIYSVPPPVFEEIAILNASSHSAFTPGGQTQIDKVVNELKAQAAAVGANGIVLDGFSDTRSGSIGTGVGSESYGRNSAVGVGVGGAFGIYKKTGRARAIYVAAP